MIVMYTITYPGTSALEYSRAVRKNFQEHPFPDFIKMTGPYALVYEGGVKSYVILDIERGKENDAFEIITRRLANYLPVPGFGWREERLVTMEEAYALVGMEAPQR